MTFDQVAIIVLLGGMVAAFARERFRVELVALTGLAVAYLVGLVPLTGAFAGFSNPAVITVVEILLVVSVLARTRAVESFANLIVTHAGGERRALAAICVVGAAVSVFMNNIGALALMFPVTLSVCARLGISPARMLMPLSFATLLGGTCSLTGTPANLIVNEWRVAQTGHNFGYFDLGSVGAPLTVIGLAWLILVAPRMLRREASDGQPTGDVAPKILGELEIKSKSPLIGCSLVAAAARFDINVHDIVREGAHVFARRGEVTLQAGDVLLVEADPDALETLHASRFASWRGAEQDRLEAVVTPESHFVGSTVGNLGTLDDHGVTVIGLTSRRRRIEGRFGDIQVGLGDVLLLAGEPEALHDAARDAALLALLPRKLAGPRPDAVRSVAIFAAGVMATAIGSVPPEIAFGGVVLAMALTGSLRLREALQDVNWTIVILLACMIPLGAAIQDTGAAQLIANAIVGHLEWTEPWAVTATILILATAITPFVDNVSVAAMLSPVAAGVASRAGMPVEPLLIAVAIGASLDFLTPFGHHNNAVVMGAAGYRFTDFPRVGMPLVGVSLLVAMASLGLFWL